MKVFVECLLCLLLFLLSNGKVYSKKADEIAKSSKGMSTKETKEKLDKSLLERSIELAREEEEITHEKEVVDEKILEKKLVEQSLEDEGIKKGIKGDSDVKDLVAQLNLKMAQMMLKIDEMQKREKTIQKNARMMQTNVKMMKTNARMKEKKEKLLENTVYQMTKELKMLRPHMSELKNLPIRQADAHSKNSGNVVPVILADWINSTDSRIKRLESFHDCTPCVKLPGLGLQRFGLIKQNKNYYEAETICQSYSGHLASFSSLSEYLLIAQGLYALKNSEGLQADSQNIWTGAKGEGTYYSFTDGTQWPEDVCTTTGCGRPWYSTFNPHNGFSKDYCLWFAVYPGHTPDDTLADDANCKIALKWFLCKF